MSDTEISAETSKVTGNAFFQKRQWHDSLHAYTSGIETLEASNQDGIQLLSILYLNRAACFLNMKDWHGCIADCSLSLVNSRPLPLESRVKALFRRASAYHKRSELSLASADLGTLLKLDPKNKNALSLLRVVKESIQSKQQEAVVDNLLSTIKISDDEDEAGSPASAAEAEDTLKYLLSLVVDNKAHALDLVRKGGLDRLCHLVAREGIFLRGFQPPCARLVPKEDPSSIALFSLRIVSAALNYKEIVIDAVSMGEADDSTNNRKALSWDGFCGLLIAKNIEVFTIAVSCILRILHALPLHLPRVGREEDNTVGIDLEPFMTRASASVLLKNLASCLIFVETKMKLLINTN